MGRRLQAMRLRRPAAAQNVLAGRLRINALLRGRISRFSLDALVNIAAHLGQRVNVELEAA